MLLEDRIDVLDQDWVKQLKQTQVMQIDRGLKQQSEWINNPDLLRNTDNVVKSILRDLV